MKKIESLTKEELIDLVHTLYIKYIKLADRVESDAEYISEYFDEISEQKQED